MDVGWVERGETHRKRYHAYRKIHRSLGMATRKRDLQSGQFIVTCASPYRLP